MAPPLDDDAGYPPSIAEREGRPFQLPLLAWFYAVAVIGAALAVFAAPMGLIVGGLILGTWMLFYVPITLVEKGVIALMVAVLSVLLLPAVQTPHTGGRRSQCQNNLKQLALALHIYHTTYGSFPPAYVAGPDGKPWHSWRVLILPYLEETILYSKYRFDEPWDGPNNRLLASRMPMIFACPKHDDAAAAHTTYFAIVGPHTMWPGAKPTSVADLRDGTADTIALVEYSGRKVSWMAPVDLSEAEVVDVLSRPDPPDFAHVGDAIIARADGSVTSAAFGSDPEYIASLCQIDDGRRIPETRRFTVSPPPRSIWPDRSEWPNYLRLGLLVVIALLPTPWAVRAMMSRNL